MNAWLRWFLGDSSRKQNTLESATSLHPNIPLFSDKHPSANEIAEAQDALSNLVEVKVAGQGTITSLNSGDYMRVKETLDRAVAKAPTDADLLYARASLHYLALQGEDGRADLDQCLALAPNHFDARTKKDHPNSWDSLCTLPGWDEHRSRLSDLMMKHLEMDHLVQVVRDHLRGAIAVVIPESSLRLAESSRIRWELRWASAPECKLAAHYLFLDNGQFQEFFIPHIAGPQPTVNSNYWLLRRLAREQYCFIVISRGRTVVRNERYMFPKRLIQTFQQMEFDLVSNGPVCSMSQFQSAARWYMRHSDESTLRY